MHIQYNKAHFFLTRALHFKFPFQNACKMLAVIPNVADHCCPREAIQHSSALYYSENVNI